MAGKKSGEEKRGRPSLYTKEIAEAICKRLANGETLRAICRDAEMPSDVVVREWALDDREGFSAHYARSRKLGYEILADEILEIADTPQIGIKTTSKATGIETTEGDMIEHRRLRVDSRKWMLAKMLPKIYGDKLAIGGAEDLPPIKTLTDGDLDARLAALMAKNAGTDEG